MINAVADFLNRFVQMDRVKGRISRFWYRYLNNLIKDEPEICFLNWGYAPANGEQIPLEPQYESNRYYVQLYHVVAGATDLSGLDVVEMSCGRGGGAKYVKRTFKPEHMLGVDLAENAVEFCTRRHAEPGLEFVCGDAQQMPLASASFDAVLSVEASHDYPIIERFFAEVRRVLKPGGVFLYADFRNDDCSQWDAQLADSGLQIVEQVDISENVARGMQLNTERTRALIRKLAPRILWPLFAQFAGTEGSLIHQRLCTGRSFYRRYVLQKP